MKTIAIMNVKGGVGKTMTACNMAHILAETYHQRVLLIDADPQANASTFFGLSDESPCLVELLEGSGLIDSYTDIVYRTEFEGIDMIPANSNLFSVDLNACVPGAYDSRKALHDLKLNVKDDNAYDVILIDCPPSFTVSAISALAAADSVIVPVKLDAFSVDGMEFLLDQLASVCRINGNVRLEGVLVTLWHNCDCNVQAEENLRSRGIKVYETHIRRSDKADESTWFHSPICDYSRYSATARDYRDFVAEFVKEGGLNNGI